MLVINGVPQPVNVGDKYVKATWFATAASGTVSGTITHPAGDKPEVAFIMDEWGSDTDALVSTISNGKPTFKSPKDAGGSTISTTFNLAGEYAFSGTPSPAGDHAVIFVYKCYLKNFNVDEALFESESIDFEASGSIATHTAIATAHHSNATDHTQGTDTTLGTMATNIAMGSNKLTGLAVPSTAGDSIRATAKITEALLESATDLKHIQGTDQGLDTGGANAVTAAEAKAGYTHSGVAHAPSNAEANNISDLNATDLTDGGDTTLHDHDGISENTAARHTTGTDTALGAVGTKNPPIDADLAMYRDSTAANVLVTSTWTQVKAFLKTYFDTLYNKYVHPNHSGEVTSAADGAQTIATAAVTLAKMANMATASLLGRNTAAIGVPEVLAKATVLSLLNVADGADVTSANETSHADVLVDGDIGVSVQAYNANLTTFNIAAALGTL